MLLKDYLNSKEQYRRILVVSDLSRGNDLLRKHEAMTGELVHNVTCMTIAQLINQVNLYIQSAYGFEMPDNIMDQTQALMLFRSIIFKNIKELNYFKNERMLDLVTTKEIFDKANLIRSNGWTGAEAECVNDRISDLKTIIEKYEQELINKEKSDNISLLQSIIEHMKKWDNLEAEVKSIFSAKISYLKDDADKWSGIQKEFMYLLQNGQDAAVELFEVKPSIELLDPCAAKAEFFRGYGSYNEASFVANDILAKKKPFGTVTVLYMSPMQLPAIQAALQGNGLKANVVSSHSAQKNAYISLARRIIAWAQDDYSEKALEKILSSSVICVEVTDEEGNKKNVLATQKYYNYVLDAAKRDGIILGWGYERNIAFIKHQGNVVKHQSKAASIEELQGVLKLHEELIDIFGINGRPYDDQNKVLAYDIYKKLVQFMENNTSVGEDFAVGMEAIRRLTGAVMLEDRVLPLNEVLTFIDELLAAVSEKDSASEDAITVQCISGKWGLLSRPNVYVIGLSLKDMQGSTAESPVLSDEEMEKCLGAGYKPTIKAKADLTETNLYRTLMTFTGESIVFGFSSYDTVGFCENNPSTFFREALQRFKGAKFNSLPEFVYGNPASAVSIASTANQTAKASYDVRTTTSNSSMEVLLDCPKKYYYSKIAGLPENTYMESDYSKWLDARLTGSFFHEIAEQYVTQRLVMPATASYQATADEVLIKSIANSIKNKMLIEVPVAFPALADRETEKLIEASISYFTRLHGTFIEEGWRALFTEIRFEKATYDIEDYNSQKYQFVFSGIIDRIDYHIDHSEKIIKLRIVDYKTGRKESKSKENELGKLLQYTVYEKALMQNGRHIDEVTDNNQRLLDVVKAKIEQLESIQIQDNWIIYFDSFDYVFPMENIDTEPLRIEAAQLEGMNITRLKCILTALQDKKTYPDHVELCEIIKEYAVKYLNQDERLVHLLSAVVELDENGAHGPVENETSHCKYCSYGDVCVRRKAGEM